MTQRVKGRKLKRLDYRETQHVLFGELQMFWKPVLGVMQLDLMASDDRGDGKTNSKCIEYINETEDMFKSEWLLSDGSEPECMFVNQPQSINRFVIPEIERRYSERQFNLIMLADARILKTEYSLPNILSNWIPINPKGHIYYYPIPHNMYFESQGIRDSEHGGNMWLVIIWVKEIDRDKLISQTTKLYQHLERI